MKYRLLTGNALIVLCISSLISCGGTGEFHSETIASNGASNNGSEDGSSVTPPIGQQFEVDAGTPQVLLTSKATATLYSQLINPKGGVPPYSMKLISLKRDGLSMPISTKLKLENGELSWTVDPTYFGDYTVSVEVTDAEGKIGIGTANLQVQLPEGLPAAATGTNAVLTKMKSLWDSGQLAGNLNDWYANRDGRHAPADSITLALNQVRIEPAIRAPGVDFQPLPNKVVIGNASLAYTTGDSWGSLPRVETSYSPAYYFDQLYKVSRGNNFFWYPEHLDHDAVDHFHFNQWLLGISQGSSTSELDEVHHDFYALASFRPEVKTALTERGLLMNILQMVRRRARVASDDIYLSGAAHTTVFDNVADAVTYRSTLVDYANSITADRLPAIAELEVVSETYAATAREHMYTGPWLVTRMFRGLEYTKKMRVSAKKSYDVNGRPLTYVWKVLRGNPARVRILPAAADSSVVDLEIDYHPSAPIITGTARTSNRVDIGLFVYNGAYYSAPALITSYTLNNETRVYDASGALVSNTPNTNYVAPYIK